MGNISLTGSEQAGSLGEKIHFHMPGQLMQGFVIKLVKGHDATQKFHDHFRGFGMHVTIYNHYQSPERIPATGDIPLPALHVTNSSASDHLLRVLPCWAGQSARGNIAV